MEPARDLLARRPPELLFQSETWNPSVHGEPVSAELLHQWSSFNEEIQNTLQGLDLSKQVSLTDPTEGEKFLVGNTRGLIARFVQSVCDPVAKAFSSTSSRDLLFGDVEAALSSFATSDAIILGLRDQCSAIEGKNKTIIAAGDIKTFWAFRLEQYQVTEPIPRLSAIEYPVGHVIQCMRCFGLKYGFLSTYKSTVFIRRVADYRFELSLPIDYRTVGPSLREYFLGFAAIASNDETYSETKGFDSRQLRPKLEASTHQATHHPSTTLGDTSNMPHPDTINARSILFGENGIARALTTCVRLIKSRMPGKAVMEVIFQGKRALAKFWSKEYYESYYNESSFYEIIHDEQSQGYDFFPFLLAFGEIVCSSLFPSGNIMILSWVGGEPLNTLWSVLDRDERICVHSQCLKAITVIRGMKVYLQDAGQHNVLYSRESRRVTMIDFEHYGQCTPEHLQTLEAPELFDIVGDSWLKELR